MDNRAGNPKPNNETCGAISRIETCERLLATRRLVSCPWLLPETVARHYARLANLSIQLVRLCECPRNDENATLQLYLLNQIHNDHVKTFGHDPAWPVSICTVEELNRSLSRSEQPTENENR